MGSASTHAFRILRVPVLLCVVATIGCTSLALDPCEDKEVLGNNTPGTARIRTSHYRAFLAHPSEAAGRVLPYALMSAYAYYMRPWCKDPVKKIRVDAERANLLRRELAQTTEVDSAWTEREDLSIVVADDPSKHSCEDNEGLMYNVWERRVGGQVFVVVAFRGTSGGGDWIYGNLWWAARFFTSDNQYTRARLHMKKIIDAYEKDASANRKPAPRFVATGHSLGGGLAQHMLYSFPDRVEQAIVFDPTPVTAFADVDRERQLAACSCEPDRLRELGVDHGPEARILRVYETDEALVNLRFFHKIFFRPERHVQEVRFPINESPNEITKHSMQTLASELFTASKNEVKYTKGAAWLASANPTCTKLMVDGQARSCTARGSGVCPQ